MRQSLVASKLNRTVINRCGKNNSEQAPQNCSCRSWLARQAVNTPFGKGVDSLLGLEGSHAIMLQNTPTAPLSALMICTPLDLVEMNN